MAGIPMTDPGFGRGQTLGPWNVRGVVVDHPPGGTSVVGTQKTFTDSDPRTSEAGKFYSNRCVTCIAVRNNTGDVLLPGQVVAFDTADLINSVSGPADGSSPFGVVDEYLNAEKGVEDQDIFWLVVSGPTAVSSAAGITFTAGDELAVSAGEAAAGSGLGWALSDTDTETQLTRALVGLVSEHSA